MEVSKLTLSNELAHQMDVKTAILVWLKEHPKAGYNTSCTNLAKTIGLARDFKATTSTGSIDQGIRRLVRMGLIMKHNINLIRADYLVNYGHPDMPAFINEGVIKDIDERLFTDCITHANMNELFGHGIRSKLKCVVQHLKGKFAPKWFDVVCANLGLTKQQMGKFNLGDPKKRKEFERNLPI